MKDRLLYWRRRNNAYKSFFNSPDGQLVLKDLLNFCYYTKPTYVVGDPYQTAHNEGLRRYALRVLKLSSLTDDQIIKLNNEVPNE